MTPAAKLNFSNCTHLVLGGFKACLEDPTLHTTDLRPVTGFPGLRMSGSAQGNILAGVFDPTRSGDLGSGKPRTQGACAVGARSVGLSSDYSKSEAPPDSFHNNRVFSERTKNGHQIFWDHGKERRLPSHNNPRELAQRLPTGE